MDAVKTKRATLQHNKELSAIFRRMSDCYNYMGREQRFRAIAYDTASKTLNNMNEPIDIYAHDSKALDELKGVGESIAEKIMEYLETGTIKTFEKLKQTVPMDLLELADIEGIGPATIRTLHDKLKVTTREELAEAIMQGKLDLLKGFGTKKIENLKKVLKAAPSKKERMPLQKAIHVWLSIRKELEKIPGIKQITPAGSLRRKQETVGDIDIILTAEKRNWKKIIKNIVTLPFVEKILASGETRASILLKENHVQVDIRIVHEHEYGSALLYFTGNKEHNIKLRLMGRQRGWKVNEYGVFDIESGKCLAGKSEEEIYALFGFHYIEPDQRLGKDEFEKARIHE